MNIPDNSPPRDAALASRYHLLLAIPGAEGHSGFQELVTEHGTPQQAGEWLATVEPALSVSSVEADARLARYTYQYGTFALRISRLDPRTIWIAVHHNGQRLYVSAHQQFDGPINQLPLQGLALPIAAQILDPLLASLSGGGLPSPSDRAQVAEKRAEELASALQAGKIEIDSSTLSHVFLSSGDPTVRLLDLIEAEDAEALLLEGLQAPNLGVFMGGTTERNALLQGCLIPGGIATGSFVAAALWAKSAGAAPIISLLFGTGIAMVAARAAARISSHTLAPRTTFRPATTLQWASNNPSKTGQSAKPLRPSPESLNTWGGIFYLLRDIAFFSGWDRPRGPAALYVDAWGIGPPELVRIVEAATHRDTGADALYKLAASLLEIRTKAIAAHLGDEAISKDSVRDQVRTLVQQATQSAPPQ